MFTSALYVVQLFGTLFSNRDLRHWKVILNSESLVPLHVSQLFVILFLNIVTYVKYVLLIIQTIGRHKKFNIPFNIRHMQKQII